MLDATAMMESPRDSIHLPPDADGILTSEVQPKRPIRNNSTHSSDTAAGIPEIHVHRSSISSSNRRPSRIRRATSPLLERAGLKLLKGNGMILARRCRMIRIPDSGRVVEAEAKN